jgi:hypothetical protein
MAANSLAGVNLARVAQKSLDALVTQLVPIKNVFLTDFSDEVAKGPTITTRYPTQPVVKELLTSAQRVSDGQTLTPVTVTIGNPRGVDIGFDDVEMINSEINLQQLFIQPAVVAIVEDIMATVFGLVTAENYAAKVTVAAADWDADQMSLLAQAMTVAKIPTSPRSAMLKPSYHGSLSRDNAVQLAYALGSDVVIRTGKVPSVHGITPYEYNGTLPANGQSLEGFACGPTAICLAARAPITPNQWYGAVENTVEPVTGLPVQFRYFYDGAQHRLQMLTQCGAAKGNPSALIRITSA